MNGQGLPVDFQVLVKKNFRVGQKREKKLGTVGLPETRLFFF